MMHGQKNIKLYIATETLVK